MYIAHLSSSINMKLSLGRIKRMCPDTGASVAIVPEQVAKDNKLVIEEADDDEPDCQSYSGDRLHIVGQTTFYASIEGFKTPKIVNAIVIRGGSTREILIPWLKLKDWGVIPESFPYPDKSSKDSVNYARQSKEFEEPMDKKIGKQHKLDIEDQEKCEKIRQKKRKMSRKIFFCQYRKKKQEKSH